MERKQERGVLYFCPYYIQNNQPGGGVKYFEAKIKKVEKFLKNDLHFIFLCGILCTVTRQDNKSPQGRKGKKMGNAIVMIEHILHCLRGMTPERRAEEILFCRKSGCSPEICEELSWAATLLAGYNEDDLPHMTGDDWKRVDEVCTRLLDWIEEAVNA